MYIINYEENWNIIIFAIISLLIGFLIMKVTTSLQQFKNDKEKLSAYECGFDPFDDARKTFEVRYYLIAILFLLLDLELVFLYPWSISLGFLSYLGYYPMIWFLMILLIGFIYEWEEGVLNWAHISLYSNEDEYLNKEKQSC